MARAKASARKPRRRKDKNAPKRALSAFMFFSNDIRDTVKKEMPELDFLKISGEIGRRWRELNEEDRKPYEELAAADKKRYQEEKEDYVPDPSFETGKAARKKKDPNAPKRPLSAYFFFCSEMREKVREENPNRKVTEIASLLAEKWRELPDKKRTKYQKMYEEARVEYDKKMKKYNNSKNGVEDEEEEEEVEEHEVVKKDEDDEEDDDDDDDEDDEDDD